MVRTSPTQDPSAPRAPRATAATLVPVNGAGTATLPPGIRLTRSAFHAEDGDLVIVTEDDRAFRIAGYFEATPRPDIATPAGSHLGPDIVEALLVAAPAAAAAPVPASPPDPALGLVATLAGEAAMVRADGTREPVVAGTPLHKGDVLETAEESALGLAFPDGGGLALGGRGRLLVEELWLAPTADHGAARLFVQRGAFAVAPGALADVADSDAFIVRTPTASLAVHGAALGGTVEPDGGTVANLLDRADGHGSGVVVVRTQAGEARLDRPGMAVTSEDLMLPPSVPFLFGQRDADGFFGDALALLPDAARLFGAARIDGLLEALDHEPVRAIETAPAAPATAADVTGSPAETPEAARAPDPEPDAARDEARRRAALLLAAELADSSAREEAPAAEVSSHEIAVFPAAGIDAGASAMIAGEEAAQQAFTQALASGHSAADALRAAIAAADRAGGPATADADAPLPGVADAGVAAGPDGASAVVVADDGEAAAADGEDDDGSAGRVEGIDGGFAYGFQFGASSQAAASCVEDDGGDPGDPARGDGASASGLSARAVGEILLGSDLLAGDDGTGTADDGGGNELAWRGRGADLLMGGGNDTFRPGGNDHPGDTVRGAEAGADAGTGPANRAGAGVPVDRPGAIEPSGRTARGDDLFGDTADDRLDGLGGNELIEGLDGDDNLFGFAGDDMPSYDLDEEVSGGTGDAAAAGEDGADRDHFEDDDGADAAPAASPTADPLPDFDPAAGEALSLSKVDFGLELTGNLSDGLSYLESVITPVETPHHFSADAAEPSMLVIGARKGRDRTDD